MLTQPTTPNQTATQGTTTSQYELLCTPEGLQRILAYRLDIKAGKDAPGPKLLHTLKEYTKKKMEDEDPELFPSPEKFIEMLFNTKAYDFKYSTTYVTANWASKEISLLSELQFSAKVKVFDDMAYEENYAYGESKDLEAQLVFLTPPMLNDKAIRSEDYDQIIKEGKFSKEEYKKLIKPKLLLCLHTFNQQGNIENKSFEVRIPGFLTDQFSGEYTEDATKALKELLEEIRKEYMESDSKLNEKLTHIAKISLYTEDQHHSFPENARLTLEHKKSGQLSDWNSQHKIGKIVFANPCTLPGGLGWLQGNTAFFNREDEQVVATSTNLLSVITGISGKYERYQDENGKDKSGSYIPALTEEEIKHFDSPSLNWASILSNKGFVEISNKTKILDGRQTVTVQALSESNKTISNLAQNMPSVLVTVYQSKGYGPDMALMFQDKGTKNKVLRVLLRGFSSHYSTDYLLGFNNKELQVDFSSNENVFFLKNGFKESGFAVTKSEEGKLSVIYPNHELWHEFFDALGFISATAMVDILNNEQTQYDQNHKIASLTFKTLDVPNRSRQNVVFFTDLEKFNKQFQDFESQEPMFLLSLLKTINKHRVSTASPYTSLLSSDLYKELAVFGKNTKSYQEFESAVMAHCVATYNISQAKNLNLPENNGGLIFYFRAVKNWDSKISWYLTLQCSNPHIAHYLEECIKNAGVSGLILKEDLNPMAMTFDTSFPQIERNNQQLVIDCSAIKVLFEKHILYLGQMNTDIILPETQQTCFSIDGQINNFDKPIKHGL